MSNPCDSTGNTSTEISSAQLTASPESERLLLSTAIREDRELISRSLSSTLAPEDFAQEEHQNLWQCRQNLEDAGARINAASVIDMAKRLGLHIGGAEYLVSLLRDEVLGAASDAAVIEAAQRVKDLSVRRQLITGLTTALSVATSGLGRTDDLIAMAADTADAARAKCTSKTSGPQHLSNFVSTVSEQIEMRLDGNTPNTSSPTGFYDLDKIIGGLSDGDLVILAARPSMGKTVFSLALADNLESAGRQVLVFSTEQSGLQLTYRMAASASAINASDIKAASFAPQEFDRLMDGLSTLSQKNIWIDETAELTLPTLRSRARSFVTQQSAHGGERKPAVIVDYLQRLTPHRQADPRIVIGEISTGLKSLAKEIKGPVIALAQLNRDLEKRMSKRPIMSDLAESGKIEQDADIIMFIYRDEYYNPETKEPGVAELIIGKNRDGAIGVAKLGFNAKQQKFFNLAPGSYY